MATHPSSAWAALRLKPCLAMATAGSIAALRAAGQMATAAAGAMSAKPKPEKKKGGLLREAAGKRWRDLTLEEWPENDYRIFVGDLGNDCNDDVLGKAFQKYPSFAKAKVRTGCIMVGAKGVHHCQPQ